MCLFWKFVPLIRVTLIKFVNKHKNTQDNNLNKNSNSTMQKRLKYIVLLLLMLFSVINAYAENRTALVIGNSVYREVPLAYPANDAKTMANVLKSLDFKVTLLTDINRKKLRKAIRSFSKLK